MQEHWYETDWNPFYFGRYGNTITIENFRLPAILCLLVFSLVAIRRRKPAGYVLCVYIFVAYVWVFLDNTVFPFPYVLRLNEFPWHAFNWVPALIAGNDPDFRLSNSQVWGNFLAGVPFGFGFPFLASPRNSTFRRMLVFGLLWGIAPELLQVIQMWLFAFIQGRSVDIDDVWLCFTGTLTGYAFLWLLARFYVRLDFSRGARLPIWNHFHDVLIRIGTPSISKDKQIRLGAERSEVKP
jgi:glycopeptide antibiotics resistance protein